MPIIERIFLKNNQNFRKINTKLPIKNTVKKFLKSIPQYIKSGNNPIFVRFKTVLITQMWKQYYELY